MPIRPLLSSATFVFVSLFIRFSIKSPTSLIGIAYPIPSTLSPTSFEELMPITSPFTLTRAPPLFSFVDRRIRLDQFHTAFLCISSLFICHRNRTVQCTDNACCHRLSVSKCISDGDRRFADFQARGITQSGN